MITDDKIAAATIAKIFGSELLAIDEKTTSRPAGTSQAARVNPTNILKGQHISKIDPLTARINQEAETLQPLPQDGSFLEITNTKQQAILQHNVQPPPAMPLQHPNSQLPQSPSLLQASASLKDESIWNKINTNLERIANRLDSLEFVVKKKRTKIN